MEEVEDFVPNLASMLEVSLVEGVDAVLSEEPTEIDGEAKSNIISVNGVATPAAKSYTETKVTDLKCNPADDENEMHSGRQEVLPTEKEDEEAKQLFYSNFKDVSMVMYLRLHCTVCNCHIGCSPAAAFTMAFHKFLRVLICKDCETFYGNGEFTCGDDGSETFCRWCGEGGHLYCCSICPNVFCKKCIRGNLGRGAMKIIGESNDWICYLCNLQPLLEHRALCWGLSTFLKEQSKDEKKIPEDEAEKSPGFNPKLCCQGEKLPFYRTSHPLRPIIFPSTGQNLTVTDDSTVTSERNGILHDILSNTLKSGGNVRITTPSTVAEMRAKPASVTVHGAASSSQPVGVVTSRAPSTEKQFMPVRTPALNNVSDAAGKLPAAKTRVEPNVSIKKSTLYVLQKQPQSTYENVFLSHLYKNGVQSGTVRQHQTPGRNSAVTVTRHVIGSTPANLKASTPLRFNQIPVRTLLLSPVPNSIAGPTVNKVIFNQNNKSGSVIHTASPLQMGAARHLQHNAVTPVPTTHNTITSSDPPKLVPLSRFPNTLVPATDPVQFTCPPHPKNAVSENDIENKTDTPSVSDGGNDDYIVEVYSNVKDSNLHEVECKWMMESLKRVNCTSRLFLYHLDFLKQKFEKEGSAKGTSHIVGKYYRLLKKVLERLNVQKEYVSKEFNFRLNAEKGKHGIPTTEGQNSSPSQDKGSDAEVTQEPELLLDMEVTCSSDHEDVSDPITEVQQNLIGCNKNLSDSGSDSDDPFSDCESNEQVKVIPVLKPILSHTVREVLRDKCSRKLLLQLLRESDSKTANVKSKIISSAEAGQSVDGKEASSVKEKEHEISKLKTHVSTGVQTEDTSANCSEISFCVPELVPCSGTEKGKSVGTEAIDSNGKDVQGSQMAPSSSGTEGKAGIESGRSKSPCKSNVAKCVDANTEVVRDSQMETSTSGAEGKTVNAECDKSNQKHEATKRKYHSVLCTVTPPHMETKRLRTRRSAAVVPNKLQTTAIPVTDFTTVVGSDVQKKLIKPCIVSVLRVNRTD